MMAPIQRSRFPVRLLLIGLLFGVLVALLLAALVGCSGGAAGAPGGTSDTGGGFVSGDGNLTRIAPAERKPAPVLSGPRLGGGEVSSAPYAGQVVVINVWGSWCAPCRAEAKDLQAASQQTKDVARFLGIDSRDASPASGEAFVRAQGITYPSLYDPDGTQLVKFASLPPSAIPATVVIDRQGRVAARVLGAVSELTLVQLVTDVAAGK